MAAEELQSIENKAQVAAAMLDNAATLISVIENMAVDLVAEYLGLEAEIEDEEEERSGTPLEFDTLQQYLPPIPPVSVEKRIGRERSSHYPAGFDHPFVSDDLQKPFKGTYEPLPKPRYPGVSNRYGSYRRPPSYGNRYKGISRGPAPPPFVDKHIGIFPSDNFLQPRYRRVQPSPYDDDTLASGIFGDNQKSRNVLSRVFPVNGNGVGRFTPDGTPYLDGFFEDDERDSPIDNGLQDAFDAALLMQNKLDREKQLLEVSIVNFIYVATIMKSG